MTHISMTREIVCDEDFLLLSLTTRRMSHPEVNLSLLVLENIDTIVELEKSREEQI